ncbi:glutathione S-transferase [Kordiimonas lacus]|uniref:Glutathione S-transferase n=1 Tax=Kordiimonas lacus TaxID=637679 RepID=A0A1G6UBL5_9PROT|nr:glutathione S-transferase [Kordiimonas lacus]SDD37975.1 Glutathione S-transferase [Kordiimonas lacus]
MADAHPILYSFRRCPYAMRARLAIANAGVGVKLREVVLRDKPAHMLEISPKGTVPVLQLADGTVIDESLDVMRWALEQHDPDGWLTPEAGTLADTLALIAGCDGDFKHHLDRYKYAARYEDVDPIEHRKAAEVFLAKLEARLNDGAWLFGSRACLADYAVLPFIRQFASVDRAWFDSAPYPALHAWLKAFMDGDFFKSVMNKYPQWQPGDAEADFPG